MPMEPDVIPEPRLAAAYVYGVGFSAMQIGLIGSIYVFYRVYQKWAANKSERAILSLSIRVPFYLAITDVLFYIDVMVNQIYPAVYGSNWPGVACKAVALVCATVALFNMFIVAAIAVSTYLKVCRGVHLDFGRYDWKLLTFIVIPTILFSLIAVPALGPSRYWCFSSNTVTSLYFAYLGLLIDYGLFLVISISYFKVYLFFRSRSSRAKHREERSFAPSVHREESSFAPSVMSNKIDLAKAEDKVTKKIMSYIFNYFIQWFPVIPSVLFPLLGYNEDWMYIICNFFMNLGGLYNAISFIRNEGFKPK
jgi:hypothetical protein